MGPQNQQIVLLSGAVAAGKSSLALLLIIDHGFQKISTSSYLTARALEMGLENRRDVLQSLGDNLDLETDYLWPVRVAQEMMARHPQLGPWLLDAVRKEKQVFHFKSAFEDVLHIHVTAPESVLRARYRTRQGTQGSRDALGSYDELIKHPNEVSSRSLETVADKVFDSSEMSAAAMAAAVMQAFGRGSYGAGGSDQRSSWSR